MDLLSIIGVAIAFAAILGGNWLEGGHLDTLANGPAMVIVLGGTIGAVLLQTPLQIFLRSMRMLGMVFVPPKRALQATIDKLVDWSKIARKDGLLGLEAAVQGEPDVGRFRKIEMKERSPLPAHTPHEDQFFGRGKAGHYRCQ